MADASPYQPLRPSTEGPHPLRPYYRPPSIGNPPSSDLPNATTSSGISGGGGGSRTKSFFSSISYDDPLGTGSGWSAGASLRGSLDDAIWKYTSVLMAQPFEVAKMVLQVRLNESLDESEKSRLKTSHSRASSSRYQDTYPSDSSDSDTPSYFTSATPSHHPTSTPKRRQKQGYSHRPNTPSQPNQANRLTLRKPSSLTEVLSQLYSRSGLWAVFQGTNVTFLYSLLHRTLEAWIRSALAALCNLPDPAGTPTLLGAASALDVLDSPSPLSSAGIAVAAAGIAGTILAPLDIVRTRLMLTPTSGSRSIFHAFRSLGTWTCPSLLLPPTILHSCIPSIFSTTTPLLLRNAGIDPLITPTTYSVASFLSSTVELFVRLPVETVLRRGQMSTVVQSEQWREGKRSASRGRSGRRGGSEGRYASREYAGEIDVEEEGKGLETLVEIGPYTGVIATMWRIARDEGERVEGPGTSVVKTGTAARRKRRGARRTRALAGVAGRVVGIGWRVGSECDGGWWEGRGVLGPS